MFQLVYSSQPTRYFEAEDCTHILMQSRRNNPKLNVTGALIFTGWHFVQALEGPEDNVRRLYEKVLQDKRHENVEILTEETIEHSEFGRWSMAFERNLCGERMGVGKQLEVLTREASEDTRALFERFLSKARQLRTA